MICIHPSTNLHCSSEVYFLPVAQSKHLIKFLIFSPMLSFEILFWYILSMFASTITWSYDREIKLEQTWKIIHHIITSYPTWALYIMMHHHSPRQQSCLLSHSPMQNGHFEWLQHYQWLSMQRRATQDYSSNARDKQTNKGTSQKKNMGLFGSFSHTRGGGVLLNPKTFVIWPSNFWHAKIILRC